MIPDRDDPDVATPFIITFPISLPDDCSANDPEAEAGPDTIRKDSMDLQDVGGGSGIDNMHQLETPELRVPMPWTKMSNDNFAHHPRVGFVGEFGCERE